MAKKLGWHFSTLDRKLGYKDGREISAGITHEVCGPIRLCEHGLHASERLTDALNYAPGPYLWRVELSGLIICADDKMVANRRKYIAGFDATELLDQFASACALSVLHLWEPPDGVVQFLCGDESARDAAEAAAETAARAARDAAWAAAETAARAAWAAAENAAEAAARAAWAAAEAAAETAAWDVLWAARAAAWEKQNEILTEYALEIING